MPQKKKNALFYINTPAQAYAWREVLRNLARDGHSIRVLARDYGSTAEVLAGLDLEIRRFPAVSNRYLRLFSILVHVYHGLRACRGFSPVFVAGFGCDAAITAALIGKPGLVFTDTEVTPFQNRLTRLFASAIVTPGCFNKDLGRKQIRVESYKELAYLHPSYFEPDPGVFAELGLRPGEKYVILRFNVFDAFHDVGKRGFNTADRRELVNELGRYARVFISPEGRLEPELEQYRLPIAYGRIHHAIYYAQLLVTDTQTMTTEAAVLGTPAVRCNSFLGAGDMGNFIELEEKYDLVYSIREPARAMARALELIRRPGLKEEWAAKRARLLREKLDLARFLTDFATRFPEDADRLVKEAGSRA